MISRTFLVLATIAATGSALAQNAPLPNAARGRPSPSATTQQRPAQQFDPSAAALAQMVQEGQAREATALSRAYAAEAQAMDLGRRLETETKRADEAEANLKEIEKAPSPPSSDQR